MELLVQQTVKNQQTRHFPAGIEGDQVADDSPGSQDHDNDAIAVLSKKAAEKLFASVSYPFTLIDETWSFNSAEGSSSVLFSHDNAVGVLKKAVETARAHGTEPPRGPVEELYDAIAAAASASIQSAKAYLRAIKESDDGDRKVEGPDPDFAQNILDGGIEGLPNIRGFELKAHLAHLKVVIVERPSATRGLTPSGVKTNVSATVELYCKRPILICTSGCFRWIVVGGYESAGSLSISDVPTDADSDRHAVEVLADLLEGKVPREAS